MATDETKQPRNIGDFVVEHADNGGVTVRRFYRLASNGGAESFEAAHTTPDEMIVWLAKQYGVEIKPRETVLHITAGQLNAQGGEHLLKGTTFDKVRVDEDVIVKLKALGPSVGEAATRPSNYQRPAIKALEEAAPRYQWKTREDFVAAPTMALTARGYPASMAPAAQARKLADIIDSVQAQGIGE